MSSGYASSSSADPKLLPLPTGQYEVFLSFRGPDVRRNFADCLYTCLVRAKIRTFRDEEELRKGETIGPSLVQAMTESKIHIPILTESYASSKWCLQELAKMVDCWKTGGRGKGQHVILPVFFLIDPRDVRHHDSGPYKEAFEHHSLKHDLQTILEWKEALQEVGKMKGWHVTESDGHGAVIDNIFTEVELHLRANYTLVTDELVGIDFHTEEVLRLLNLDSGSEKTVGIHGMGGLGKTTLAKAVYDKVSTQFERCCFLENTREALLKNDGAVTLQNKIISDILRKDSHEVKDASDGIRVIRERVTRHKLFIVLDDVDEKFPFDDILGKLYDFSMDSRFLITTRDARVLELIPDCQLFELEEMSHDHSLKLFSKHAFGVDYPPEDYASLSAEFVHVAAGLPLAVKVIGSLLFHTEKSFWEEKLVELKEIPPAKVQERLKISYNELAHYEKQIFLDVACFFVGAKKEVPMYMWSDCDLYPASAIRTLIRRSLLKVNENKKFWVRDDVDFRRALVSSYENKVFWMHDHIRDLGRSIVRDENNQNPYKRSRIWTNNDAIALLKYREGTDCVEALVVDMKGENQVLTSEDFKKLSRLRYLEVWNGRLAGNFSDVLPNIRWLRLYRCDSFPSGLNLKKLVILGLENCSVRDGLQGIEAAHKLKVVNLLDCLKLEKVPDLSNCEGLELLDFSRCERMRGELNIQSFKNLRLLGARNTKITKLKGDMSRLQYLQKLDVSHTSLIKMPAGISKLSSLEVLDLTLAHPNKPHFTEMLPDSLKSLAISSFSLPPIPSSLNYFDLCYCELLRSLPNLGFLTNLAELRLNKIGIPEIPGLGELKLLEILYVFDAPDLENLAGLENLVLLKELSVFRCSVLGKLPSLAPLTKLYMLAIKECPVLTEVHGLGELRKSLSHLGMSECSGLTGMVALRSMVNLESLVLEGPELTNMLPPSLSTFTKLSVLYIQMLSLRQFPDLSNVKSLRDLMIVNCNELIVVAQLDTLESLEELTIWKCGLIRELPDLSGLKKLKKLYVTGCALLTEVRGLDRLESLDFLSLSGCKSIKELPNLSTLKNLRELYLRKCRELKEVNGLEELESLEVFDRDKRLRVRCMLKSVSRYGKRLATPNSWWGSL